MQQVEVAQLHVPVEVEPREEEAHLRALFLANLRECVQVWRARSWLYRSRCLQGILRIRFASRQASYNWCTLHRFFVGIIWLVFKASFHMGVEFVQHSALTVDMQILSERFSNSRSFPIAGQTRKLVVIFFTDFDFFRRF